jgi:hypothetical protein
VALFVILPCNFAGVHNVSVASVAFIFTSTTEKKMAVFSETFVTTYKSVRRHNVKSEIHSTDASFIERKVIVSVHLGRWILVAAIQR